MSMESGENLEEHQKIRAELRKSYLETISSLVNKECEILTYAKSTLKGTISGWKPDGSEVLIKDLLTPSGIHPNMAMVIMKDVLTITFD